MMKKIMIAGFWALLLIPNLLFPFVKGSSQTGTGENRNLAEFPVFSRYIRGVSGCGQQLYQ